MYVAFTISYSNFLERSLLVGKNLASLCRLRVTNILMQDMSDHNVDTIGFLSKEYGLSRHVMSKIFNTYYSFHISAPVYVDGKREDIPL